MDDFQENKIGIPGVPVNARFWFFKEKVDATSISNRAGKLLGQKIISAITLIIFVLSLFVFLLGVVLDIQIALFETDTWLEANVFILFFWIAILFGSFLFFRYFDEKTRKKTVPKCEQSENLNITILPTLDVVEKKGNIAEVLTEEAYTALEEAFEVARSGGHSRVLSIHLFVGAISTKQVQMMLMRLGISFDQIKDALRRRMQTVTRGETVFGIEAEEIIVNAFLGAIKSKEDLVSAVEIFRSAYNSDEFLQELMFSVKVEKEEFENTVQWIKIDNRLQERYRNFRKSASFKSTGTMNKAYTSQATPFLDRVSDDITILAAQGALPLMIGREKEVQEILRSIEGGMQSVVLVGHPGVGKNSIIHGIAERMVAEDVPKILQDKRLVQLSIPHIVSAEGGANAQERLLVALQEVGISGNIILVIENLDQLMGGFAANIDLSAVLSSELDKRYTFVIGTSTPEGYASKIERSILSQKFNKVNISEPVKNDTIQILQSKISGIENKNKVVFTYPALSKVIDLSDRYMHETFLPEKAILLAREVGNMVGAKGEDWQRVSEDDIAEIISQKTQVPVTEVTQGEGEKLLNLEDRIHERMIGQDDAVRAISSALRRARVELRAENRPIANFLFLGPTGVGKTELAKTTAEVYFGNEESMIRIDMSEYQDQASIARLIGGANEGGLLTEAVRKNPFSLLLLDELEKAHPDILNIFLQVMDDGRLTDGAGRTIDFTNVILIATSNAGTQFIQDEVEKGTGLDQIKNHLLETELKQIYRPEFLNRFDGVMVFKPLLQDDVVSIAYLMIEKVAGRLSAKGITFRATDEAVHELAQKGYDPKFGARPLRRVIQENVENAVAEQLLRGEVGRRDTLVLEPGGTIEIEKAAEL